MSPPISLLLYLCLLVPPEADPRLDCELALSPTTYNAYLANTQIKEGSGLSNYPTPRDTRTDLILKPKMTINKSFSFMDSNTKL